MPATIGATLEKERDLISSAEMAGRIAVYTDNAGLRQLGATPGSPFNVGRARLRRSDPFGGGEFRRILCHLRAGCGIPDLRNRNTMNGLFYEHG